MIGNSMFLDDGLLTIYYYILMLEIFLFVTVFGAMWIFGFSCKSVRKKLDPYIAFESF